MGIEFKQGRYFVGIWYGEYAGGNVMFAMYRDEGQKAWTLFGRVRRIVDELLGDDSADERKWFEVRDPSRARMVARVESMMKDFPFETDYQPIEEDGSEWFERYHRLGLLPKFFSHSKEQAADGSTTKPWEPVH